MDQSQTKALAAIQPFVHLATTTKTPSPRFIAELIKGAISAPGAYIFTELLSLPVLQSLRGTEAEPWLTLLEIFSWGTYEEYKADPSLPPLDEAQTFKLRQLSLLSLASPFAPTSNNNTTANALTYPALLASLLLSTPQELESLITQSIYSGLLTARLSPTSTPPTVHIMSVAPLRDLRPHSLPVLLQILQTWESRCVSVVSDLEAQIAAVRATAQQRAIQERSRQSEVDSLVLRDDRQQASSENGFNGRAVRGAGFGAGQRPPSKRDLDQQMEGEGDDVEDDYEEGRMDLDEGISDSAGGFAGFGSRGGGSGGSRGAKRNRGRGSK
ncbi:uncharacterized protein Z520_09456 [Fonsecaea multimorphosa CBS 102226]|uniref:PCI domain-containing protein n=1 Tax=Fonsecaea multimorphosa CBS 102226 TaxID=1442371 RepID=A0A0D2IC91_9EURO|nr:uncharacterized protein Z520_09456 [Fonsecaea multimorphosa CBS 102226]KIX94766.1 hypothetical protein Z520_09456 [Fonsecaea multimorphosa CBS 102226]OAL20540.1 hypothetical protein AYO22_08841 [Fonsecaea multimorphosa]